MNKPECDKADKRGGGNQRKSPRNTNSDAEIHTFTHMEIFIKPQNRKP